MCRGRALAVAVLLLSYGAVGARQPAVRVSLPLPLPASDLAAAAGVPVPDPATLLLEVVRILYDAPDAAMIAAVNAALPILMVR